MTYPVKIEFREYPSGLWQNWSGYLSEAPTINRRVESENEGEAGVIVFDNASVTFRYDSGNPVYAAFNQDLSEKQRYLFRISAPDSAKIYHQLFEGMADFSTITWAGEQDIISFEVVDKLSALGVIPAVPARVENTLVPRILSQAPDAKDIMYSPGQNANEVYLIPRNLNHSPIDINSPLIFPGEILVMQVENDPPEYRNYVVVNSIIEVYEYTSGGFIFANKATVSPSVDPAGFGEITFAAPFNQVPVFYEKELYAINVNNIVSGTLTNLNGLEIILALYNQAWQGAALIKKPDTLTFPVPVEYAIRMVTDEPLGETPLEALKTLADSMKCYIYVDREGNLVIHSKSDLALNGTTQSIGNTKRFSSEKKYFWDKLIDGVSVIVKSWVQNEDGEYLEGRASIAKQTAGSGFIKPKNELSKELLIDDSTKDTQEELNSFAAAEAAVYLDFYGNRRSALDITLRLDDNTLNWELIDNIEINGDTYFFTGLDVDLVEKTISLTLAETASHEYDPRQAVVALSEGNSVSLSSGGSSPGTITIGSSSYIFSPPLQSEFNTVSLLKTDNFKLTDGALDTIQPVKTISTPEFAKLGINKPADISYHLAVLGDGWLTGHLKLDGDLKIAETKEIKINDVLVLSADTLGESVVNSSLTKVGVLTQGTWNAVPVNAPYINFHTANLKSTSNQLNTIQDIHTAANNQFNRTVWTDYIGSNSFASQLTGWRVGSTGSADFRYVYTDELHAKAFIADLEQALAGSQIICKSVAKVASDFTLPPAGSGGFMIVESFAGFETAAVFQNGDLVRVRQFSRTSGSLVISDAWVTVNLDTTYGVNGFNTSANTQAYTFTRHPSVPGSASGTIKEGTLALDYGVSGNGFIESNAADGLWAVNSPYHQVVTWSSIPSNYTIHNRTGRLTGITDSDFGGSLPASFGTYINGTAFIKGNIFVKAVNQLLLQSNSIMIGNISGTADNAIKFSQTGITSTSGIFLYDGSSNELLKFALNGSRHIANWNFDSAKFYKGTAASGFSLNTSTTAFITGNNSSGFEIYDINNPKMFLGQRDSSGNLLKGFDWNITAADEFTMKGNILASRFTTKTSFGAGIESGVEIDGQVVWLYHYDAGSYERMRILSDSIGFEQSSNGISFNTRASISGATQQLFLGSVSLTGGLFNNLQCSADFKISTSSGKLLLEPDGDIIVDPGNKNFMPETDYDINLGTFDKKFLTIHASELRVQSLVRQNVMATIGGRILVGETLKLKVDFDIGNNSVVLETQITTSLPSVCYLEDVDSGGAKVEFIQINSYVAPSQGGYRYNVSRNLDGSGQNNWKAGSAVFNTGNTGSGFIDIYSVNGLKGASQAGPAIVGNVRNSLTYNNWSEHWAIGNLNGLYGNASTIYGAAFGKYGVDSTWIQADATNGISFKHKTSLGTVEVAKWATNGAITIGDATGFNTKVLSSGIQIADGVNTLLDLSLSGVVVGRTDSDQGNVSLTSNALQFRLGSTPYMLLDLDVTPRVLIGREGSGLRNILIQDVGIYIRENLTTKLKLDSGGILIGETGSGQSNILLTSGAVKLRNNTTDVITLNSDGTGNFAGNITSTATITGGTIKTAASGERIEINQGGHNAITFYTDDAHSVYLYPHTEGVYTGIYTNGHIHANNGFSCAADIKVNGGMVLLLDLSDVFLTNGKTLIKLDTNDFFSTPGITIRGDTNLYRFAANTLKTDDDMVVGGNFTTNNASLLGNLLVTNNMGNIIINSPVPSTNSYFGIQNNGTLKGIFGCAWANNNLINGSVLNDMCIRSSQKILFSINDGTNIHFSIQNGAPVFPSYTTAQRNALTAINGMIIYNTTTLKLEGRANGGWVALH